MPTIPVVILNLLNSGVSSEVSMAWGAAFFLMLVILVCQHRRSGLAAPRRKETGTVSISGSSEETPDESGARLRLPDRPATENGAEQVSQPAVARQDRLPRS